MAATNSSSSNATTVAVTQLSPVIIGFPAGQANIFDPCSLPNASTIWSNYSTDCLKQPKRIHSLPGATILVSITYDFRLMQSIKFILTEYVGETGPPIFSNLTPVIFPRRHPIAYVNVTFPSNLSAHGGYEIKRDYTNYQNITTTTLITRLALDPDKSHWIRSPVDTTNTSPSSSTATSPSSSSNSTIDTKLLIAVISCGTIAIVLASIFSVYLHYRWKRKAANSDDVDGGTRKEISAEMQAAIDAEKAARMARLRKERLARVHGAGSDDDNGFVNIDAAEGVSFTPGTDNDDLSWRKSLDADASSTTPSRSERRFRVSFGPGVVKDDKDDVPPPPPHLPLAKPQRTASASSSDYNHTPSLPHSVSPRPPSSHNSVRSRFSDRSLSIHSSQFSAHQQATSDVFKDMAGLSDDAASDQDVIIVDLGKTSETAGGGGGASKDLPAGLFADEDEEESDSKSWRDSE